MRTTVALVHLHLLRLRITGKAPFLKYAKPIFRDYVQSLNPKVNVLPFCEAMLKLGIDVNSLSVSLPELHGYVGLTDWDRIVLASAAKRFSDHPMFEIGTAAGSTALLLANNTDGTIYTLDLPEDSADQEFALTRMATDDQVIEGRKRGSFLREYEVDNVVELIGDSALFDYSPYFDTIGLFFIDGAHSYEYVSSDTFKAAKCCRQDAVIFWDDFGGSRDVSRFLSELASNGVAVYGVVGTKLAFSKDIEKIRSIESRIMPRVK